MTQADRSPRFRMTNQSIGQQPTLGPIPTNLLVPSGIILVITYFVIRIVLQLSFPVFLLTSIWTTSVWWVVVGEKTWKFTNKFVPVPDWCRGRVRYISPLSHHEP